MRSIVPYVLAIFLMPVVRFALPQDPGEHDNGACGKPETEHPNEYLERITYINRVKAIFEPRIDGKHRN